MVVLPLIEGVRSSGGVVGHLPPRRGRVSKLRCSSFYSGDQRCRGGGCLYWLQVQDHLRGKAAYCQLASRLGYNGRLARAQGHRRQLHWRLSRHNAGAHRGSRRMSMSFNDRKSKRCNGSGRICRHCTTAGATIGNNLVQQRHQGRPLPRRVDRPFHICISLHQCFLTLR